jgi:hypothetical protein
MRQIEALFRDHKYHATDQAPTHEPTNGKNLYSTPGYGCFRFLEISEPHACGKVFNFHFIHHYNFARDVL